MYYVCVSVARSNCSRLLCLELNVQRLNMMKNVFPYLCLLQKSFAWKKLAVFVRSMHAQHCCAYSILPLCFDASLLLFALLWQQTARSVRPLSAFEWKHRRCSACCGPAEACALLGDFRHCGHDEERCKYRGLGRVPNVSVFFSSFFRFFLFHVFSFPGNTLRWFRENRKNWNRVMGHCGKKLTRSIPKFRKFRGNKKNGEINGKKR